MLLSHRPQHFLLLFQTLLEVLGNLLLVALESSFRCLECALFFAGGVLLGIEILGGVGPGRQTEVNVD